MLGGDHGHQHCLGRRSDFGLVLTPCIVEGASSPLLVVGQTDKEVHLVPLPKERFHRGRQRGTTPAERPDGPRVGEHGIAWVERHRNDVELEGENPSIGAPPKQARRKDPRHLGTRELVRTTAPPVELAVAPRLHRALHRPGNIRRERYPSPKVREVRHRLLQHIRQSRHDPEIVVGLRRVHLPRLVRAEREDAGLPQSVIPRKLAHREIDVGLVLEHTMPRERHEVAQEIERRGLTEKLRPDLLPWARHSSRHRLERQPTLADELHLTAGIGLLLERLQRHQLAVEPDTLAVDVAREPAEQFTHLSIAGSRVSQTDGIAERHGLGRSALDRVVLRDRLQELSHDRDTAAAEAPHAGNRTRLADLDELHHIARDEEHTRRRLLERALVRQAGEHGQSDDRERPHVTLLTGRDGLLCQSIGIHEPEGPQRVDGLLQKLVRAHVERARGSAGPEQVANLVTESVHVGRKTLVVGAGAGLAQGLCEMGHAILLRMK